MDYINTASNAAMTAAVTIAAAAADIFPAGADTADGAAALNDFANAI